MEPIEEISHVVDVFADHFISSKNITFLRHIAFLPFDKTKLIEINFLTEEVTPREVGSKTVVRTIEQYRKFVEDEIVKAKFPISSLTRFSVKLTYKPGDLTRYYTCSVLFTYDGRDYTKSVLSSFS